MIKMILAFLLIDLFMYIPVKQLFSGKFITLPVARQILYVVVAVVTCIILISFIIFLF